MEVDVSKDERLAGERRRPTAPDGTDVGGDTMLAEPPRRGSLRQRLRTTLEIIRSNPTGRINAWKSILNALTIHYGDRIQAAN